MQSYRSARPRAELFDVLVAAQLALLALQAAGWLVVALVGDGELARLIERGTLRSWPFLLLLFLAATVTFGVWALRLCANLPAFGRSQRRVEPDTAMVLALVPFMNLVGIPLVAYVLWQESDPTPPPAGRVRATMATWLAALVGAVLLGLGAAGEPLRLAALTMAASTTLWLVAGVSCLRVVRDTQRRQDEQWIDLSRRRELPRPSGGTLR